MSLRQILRGVFAQSRSGQGMQQSCGMNRVMRRGFASGEEITHEGLKLHATGGIYAATGTTIAAAMWFWIFYRFYNDYDAFLFGHAQHFEHELHEQQHGDHKH